MMLSSVLLLSVAAVLGADESGHGPQIKARASSTEALLGEAVTVEVTLTNFPQPITPTPPVSRDFDIRPARSDGQPSKRHQEISFGRRTIRYTYVYIVRPSRTGTFVIPPFTVIHRGRTHRTNEIPIRVTKDTSGPYLICEIEAPSERIYVGQEADLELKIYVRKFRQDGLELSAQDLWGQFDSRASRLGVFADVGNVTPYETKRKSSTGELHEFYMYVMQRTVYAASAGLLDLGEIEVVFKYPRRLTRNRSFLFNRWSISEARWLTKRPEIPDILVLPIPTEGRPLDFNGAIGRYTISARARPGEVPVGDPVTLTMTISGEGPLEQLLPPRLEQVEVLSRDFEVSGESLAGEIRGQRKLFSQTIRALREDVTEIPPISFSYFDPHTGRFDTAWSKPIPLVVTPAERLALPTLAGPGNNAAVLTPLVETTEGLLANVTDPEALLADRSATIGRGALFLLAVMPAVYLLTWFIQRRAARYRDDQALRRRSRAYSTAKKALRQADATLSPGQVRNALIGYIADRCNVPAGGLTRADAGQLTARRNVPAETVEAIDALLESLEQAQYGSPAGESLQDGAESARRFVDAMERCKFK